MRVLLAAALVLIGCVEEGGRPAPAPVRRPGVYNGSERELFDEVARSLVGAHEALGRLDPAYDVEGDCGEPGEDGGCYIWRFRSTNPSVRVLLTRFQPHGAGGAAGDYEGFVHFVEQRSGQLRRIDLKLRFTGDELQVRLFSRTLPARGTNS